MTYTTIESTSPPKHLRDHPRGWAATIQATCNRDQSRPPRGLRSIGYYMQVDSDSPALVVNGYLDQTTHMVDTNIKDPVVVHRLGFGRVYRDDLEKVVELLSIIGPIEIKVRNQGREWVSRSLADLSHPDVPRRLETIVIMARSRSGPQMVEVILGRKGSAIKITSPSTFTAGVQSELLTKVLHPRLDDSLVPRLLFQQLVLPIPLALTAFGLVYLFFNEWLLASLAGVEICLVELWIAQKIAAKRGDVTVATSQRSHSFLSRARDDRVVQIFLMLLSLILGYLLGQLT